MDFMRCFVVAWSWVVSVTWPV